MSLSSPDLGHPGIFSSALSQDKGHKDKKISLSQDIPSSENANTNCIEVSMTNSKSNIYPCQLFSFTFKIFQYFIRISDSI